MSRKCSGWHGQPTVAVRAIVVTITALVAACSDPPSAPTTPLRPQAATRAVEDMLVRVRGAQTA